MKTYWDKLDYDKTLEIAMAITVVAAIFYLIMVALFIFHLN